MEGESSAAVVVTYNNTRYLAKCLTSLCNQSEPFRRIILVDNANGRGTRSLVKGMAGIELIASNRNLGFAAGANRGIVSALSDATVDAVALVNDDAILDGHWHREARRTLLSHPKTGACATCLCQAHTPALIDTAGIVWQHPGWANNYLHGKRLDTIGNPDQTLLGACAAAALYRREMLSATGGFDEVLFAYQEDVDLALRAQNMGWHCRFAIHAHGLHIGFGSNRPFPLGGSWADYYNARNRLYVLIKAWPKDQWRRHGWHIIGRQLCMVGKSFASGRAPAVLAGVLHLLLRLPQALRTRRRALAHGKVTDERLD
jgi:GT2 family glycosyltransferase